MTVTPEQADKLSRNAPDGPWKTLRFAYEGIHVMNANDDFLDPDKSLLALLAAAPDLAQTIAGMEWQWGVERAYRSGTETAVLWFSSEDDARQEIDNPNRQHGNPRLVRRLVGPVEEAE